MNPTITNTSLDKMQVIPFLQGGGEMGMLMRSKDWSKTSVGIPQTWPQSLRTTLNIILNSKFPMFLWWGPELICFYNDSYRPSLGNEGKHPSILGMPAKDAWPEIWDIIKPLIDQVLSGGGATWSEDQLVPIFRNGHIEDVYWTFSYSPVIDESGEIAGVLVTCNETTEKVNTLKRLEESNRRYLNNIVQAPVAMCIFRGKDHVVEIANDLMLEIWGKSAGEVMNKPIFEGLPEAKGQGIEPLLEHVFNTGEKFVANERSINLPRNGKIETTYINFVYEALKGPGGIIIGIVAIATDVTAQVLARKKVEESDQKFRSLVKSAPFPIGVYAGKDMRIEVANEAIIKAWGKGEAVLGKSFRELMPELVEQQIFEQLDHVYRTGIPFHATNRFLNLVIDGKETPYYYNYSFTPVFDASGNIYGVMNTASDVTDLNLAKKKIEQSENDLRSMVLQSPVGICILDAATLVSEIVNDSFIEVAGKRYDEIAGKYYWDTFAEARPYYESALKDVVEKGVAFHADEVELMLIRHGQKEVIYVTFVYSPLKDAEGNVKKVAIWVLENTQQVKARIKIEEADKRFRNTVKQAPIGITILRGAEYMVEMANDAYLELVDRREIGFVGKPLFASLPEVEETVHPLLDKVLNTGVPFHGIEYPIPVRRFGKYEVSYFNFLYYPLKEDDKISGIIVTVTDVTESVKAKHSLAESERQFRNLVMQSPVPMTIFRGSEYIIELANTVMFENIWRRNEKDVIGKKVLDVFPELIAQKYPTLLNQVFTTGELYKEIESVAYVRGDDGMKKFYLDFEYKPLFETDGRVSGIMITVNDVTEKVEARIKIEESERKFRLLADSMPQHIWTSDAAGNLNYFNQSVYRYSGYRPENFDPADWLKIVHEEDKLENTKAWKQSIETGDAFLLEHRFRRYDGEYRWQLSRALPVKDNSGKIQMWVGTSTDIHDLKKHEQLKDDFIKMASHELKTPVTTIKGYIQLLMSTYKETNDPMLSNSLSTIDKHVSKLTKLITDLLDVTKIETGSLHISKEHFNINELIGAIINDIQTTTSTHKIIFNPDSERVIFADKDRISQVIINLLINAVKYSPKADKVIVTTSASNEFVISIRDFGIGIYKDDHDKIFERFYRVQGKNEKTFPGFGIGLFVVKEIISNHNGRVWVESEKDQGSVFYFSLPFQNMK